MKKKIKSEKGAIAALVVVTVLMFVLILMGTYMAITNLRKSQLESDIRIQQIYGGELDNIEESYNSAINNLPEIPIEQLKVGDYIKYNSGENGVITCRVLYEANSEYGLQIISDKNVKNVTLGGSDWKTAKESYNTAIENLNNEAEEYINDAYASDARCVGSIPTIDENGIFVEKDSVTETTIILPPGDWRSYTRPSGWESDDTGCYGEDNNYMTDEEQLKEGNIWITGEYYWLASHFVYPDSTKYTFYVRYTHPEGDMPSSILCMVYNDGTTEAWQHGDTGLRPCIALKSDITVRGGDGSMEKPYIIV